MRANLIENVFATDVWAAFGLFNRFQIAIAWPMTIYQNGQSFDDVNPPPDGTHVKAPNGFALGDPRLHLKGLIYGKAHGAQVAITARPQLIALDLDGGHAPVCAEDFNRRHQKAQHQLARPTLCAARGIGAQRFQV